jgi:hypothetical protein
VVCSTCRPEQGQARLAGSGQDIADVRGDRQAAVAKVGRDTGMVAVDPDEPGAAEGSSDPLYGEPDD